MQFRSDRQHFCALFQTYDSGIGCIQLPPVHNILALRQQPPIGYTCKVRATEVDYATSAGGNGNGNVGVCCVAECVEITPVPRDVLLRSVQLTTRHRITATCGNTPIGQIRQNHALRASQIQLPNSIRPDRG
ncbi:hypothetical protein D3C81_902910 [compost metagenome]